MAGSSYDIVILSSSPPAPELYAPSSPLLNGNLRSSPRRVAMAASPLLTLSPPVSPQNRKSGASALGSRKASIPPDAIRGFATVGSLVRSEHFAQQLDNDLAEVKQAQSRRGSLEDDEGVKVAKKNPRKRSAAIPAPDGDGKLKLKPSTRNSKTGKEKAMRDPELRLPAPKISPYFPKDGAEASIEPPDEPADSAPKLTKPGKPRKPRAKKEKAEAGDADPRPKKARVTKTKGIAKAAGKSQREDTCIESAHFHKDTDRGEDSTAHRLATLQSANNQSAETEDTSLWEVPPSPQPKKKRPPKQRPPDIGVESLDLDEAVSRRRDWTPPKDTAISSPFTDSVGKENKQIEPDANNGNFTHMISNFAYAQSPSAQVTVSKAASTTEMAAVAKRRRVELVDVPGNQSNSRNSSPEKGKAPKKKARTITDIATEQYQPRNVNLDPSGVTSDFFQPRTTVTKVPLNDTEVPHGEVPPKKPPRKRSTSKTDSEKTASKAKSKKASAKSTAKPKPIAETLLSPGSALMRMSKQDILFGTSSQLALEESPTLVRQIQQAIKESEHEADISLGQPIAPPHWPKLERAIGKRSLWDASSRNVEGGLLEQMEDVYIPDFDRTQDFPLLMDGTNDASHDSPLSFVDIDDIEAEAAPAIIISSDRPTPPPTTSRGSQTVPSMSAGGLDDATRDSVFRNIDDFDSQPPPSNQNVESQNSFTDIDDVLPASTRTITSPPPKPRPPASASATDSLKKRRGHPSKSKSATLTAAASPVALPKKRTTKAKSMSMSEPPATPPKASGRFIDIDEILDSEDEVMQALSPTPPRVHKLQDSQPLPLFCTSPTRTKTTKKTSVNPNVVPVHRIPSSQLDWGNLKSSVFSSITTHIRSLPPTHNPKQPSWHEKILMYDPIVLEDLTAHLNAHTGIRTWKRATKIQAKAWNKAMKATSGEEVFVLDNGEEVLAVEKELEVWQVQTWCESMSVCCIWGEGRGKAGVRKGFY